MSINCSYLFLSAWYLLLNFTQSLQPSWQPLKTDIIISILEKGHGSVLLSCLNDLPKLVRGRINNSTWICLIQKPTVSQFLSCALHCQLQSSAITSFNSFLGWPFQLHYSDSNLHGLMFRSLQSHPGSPPQHPSLPTPKSPEIVLSSCQET